jgi:hypothetical protein
MRWVLVIVGGVIGAAVLLMLLPHRQQPQLPRGVEAPHVVPHAPSDRVGVPHPSPTPRPVQPSTPAVTPIVKCGVIVLGLFLLFWFRDSEKVQTAALMLITSGALALLGQAVVPQ